MSDVEQPQAARGGAGGAVRGRAATGVEPAPGAGDAGAPAAGAKGRKEPDPLLALLARRLPDELAEVLIPALALRRDGHRLFAVLPNPAWRDAFVLGAEAELRALLPAGDELAVVAGDEAAPPPAASRRLDDAIPDPGNQLALAACRRAVAAPGLEHNPLYLHGPAGCGKGFLVEAVAGEFRAALGPAGAVVVSGEDFVGRCASELASRDDTPLRRALSAAALFAVDGVEALAGRALAQEELFHLVDAALDRGQQLLFAGRHPPSRIPGLEERLATRLAWGLVVGIEPPLTETRLALLRRLHPPAAGDPALAPVVAELTPDLHQVVALARRLAAGGPARPAQASLDRILAVVAARWHLRPGDLASPRRHRAISQARQAALLLARRLTGHSARALGGMIGGRDHSSVLYAIHQAEERAAADPAFAAAIAELTAEVLR